MGSHAAKRVYRGWSMRKNFNDLCVNDILEHPIWRFTNNNPQDELEIEAIDGSNLTDLGGVTLSSKVTFADGSSQLALFQNVSLAGQKVNDHFLSLTIEKDGEWFPLARYHDVAFDRHGPLQLSSFVGKKVQDVFPIEYDLREILKSHASRLVGVVHAEPPVRLTDEQLISLALL